jgi:hypothetical protein
LLLFWDVSYNGFDFLVDGVGFLLVALGCTKLAAHSSKFQLSQKIALVLAALWLIFSVILPSLKISVGDLGFALGVIGRALDMLMIWFVCSGIRELAMERQLLQLAKKATRRGIAYAVMNLGMWIFGGLLIGLGLFPILLNFIVLGFILHLLLVARRELSAQDAS